MTDLIRVLIAWVGLHPYLAGLVIGIVAFGESLAFVGLVVPGALVLFGAGALIAGGSLAFWPIALAATSGAILGDGVSYWLGYRYREHVRELWPISRYPQLLERGERFFLDHGGKSIMLGRFAGPVRPIVPIVAGMLGMPPLRFYLTNVLSAVAWAPAYLLPGMAFGASLALAGEVAGRLAVLLGSLAIACWGVVAAARFAFRRLQPHAADWARRGLLWARGHPRLTWLIGDLLDPAGPAFRALALWIVLLVAATWLFFGVLEHTAVLRADETIYRTLQALRTPLGDRIMIVFSQLGDWPVTTATTIASLAWLVWRRAKRDALYWLATIAFAWLAVAALTLLLQLPDPAAIAAGTDGFGLPSEHATMSVVIYGYLAVLGAHDLPLRRRWIPYGFGAMLIAGITFSRLYLGAHWFSDAAAGLALGLAGVAVIAIARERHLKPFAPAGILWVAAATLLIGGFWHARDSAAKELERYARRASVQSLEADEWRSSAWQRIPAYRIDVAGEREQPLNLQVAGSLDELRERLRAGDWRAPVRLSPRSALRWLAPNLPVTELPLVPQLHDGRYDALTLILPSGSPAASGGALLLRLWPSAYRLEPGDEPVWIGTVARLDIERLPLISLPRTTGGYGDAEAALSSQLVGLGVDALPRRAGPGEGRRSVLLVAVGPASHRARAGRATAAERGEGRGLH